MNNEKSQKKHDPCETTILDPLQNIFIAMQFHLNYSLLIT